MTTVRALLVPVNEDVYALDAAHVREVVAAPAPTLLPAAPAWVLGVINVRGEIVPLLDTAALLGIGSIAGPAFSVIVQAAVGPAALAATGIPEFTTLGDDVGAPAMTGAVSRHRIGEGLAVRLDIDALLSFAQGEHPPVPSDVP